MSIAATNDSTVLDGFENAWEEWHHAVEERRADREGLLAVTGLYWLGEEPLSLPGAPGRWTTGAEGAAVELADGEQITVHGRIVTGRHVFGPIAERGGVTVRFAAGAVEVARRGGRDIVRPRRHDHPFLAAYRGTPAYAPDARWRVPARFVEYARPRPVEVGSALDGIQHVYDAPGYLEFDLGGETQRLVAFPGHTEGTLEVLFTDATSGVTTYAANRRVGVRAPDADGRTEIDFTRASNFPCAYTDFATCPLPPAENRLRIAIEAGEQTPVARVHGVAVSSGLALAGAS